MAKMWAGRTDGTTEKIADDFNSSIRFDCRMYRQDITGSMAHAAMLAARNIITQSDADALIAGLEGILNDLDSGKLTIDMECEDIHMFVEQVLTQRIGDVGKKLHTARSRNDQVALDIRMYLRSEIDEITALTKALIAAVLDKAEEYKSAIMPGYTHLQRAQPITFGHQLMAYAMMLLRDLDRLADCRKRMNRSPIGCCALAQFDKPKFEKQANVKGPTRSNPPCGSDSHSFSMSRARISSIVTSPPITYFLTGPQRVTVSPTRGGSVRPS